MLENYRKNNLFHLRETGVGIVNDVRTRLVPYYVSDFLDAWNYRVIPAVVYVFFTNLLPAVAFAQDMFDHTENSYGVNEVLMSSAMGGVVFGLIAGQPLCIVGVTGPITIFNYTVFNLIRDRDIDYFSFMCWICLWAGLLHTILALLNAVNFMRYVSKYCCNVFGLFINVVYIQKGIQILTHQFDGGSDVGFASVMVSLVMCIFGVAANLFGTKSHYLRPTIRKFVADYSTPLCVVFFSGFVHFGGKLAGVRFQHLPITKAFAPTLDSRPNDWFVRFWHGVDVGDVFLALPFGILLTALFYFDHNVSSLMCQSSDFPLKKPASFHYDFLLLGITTAVAGLLGIPAPNGLIPQAPLHTHSLCVQEHDYKTGTDRPVAVVEQRLTNTLQGLMTIGMMTRPLLIVLHQIPQPVMAGLFWIMGISALNENEIINRIRFLCTDPETMRTNPQDYPLNLRSANRKWLVLFVTFELIAFGFEFGITCTKGAVGFPGVLMFFLGFSCFFPKIFPPDQLRLLDGPAADDMILENLRLSKGDEEYEL
ncbi:unnamed protein product [Kuraishia capsulata CBS 1993]|uniref:Bicarbonate transporter-like transmembrane domain-containing protein n=1 Tax=Kuraishia capsulata CBS 1993 TaxID=1382522 RepID=W6MKF8_9ASCO|nr:uncharacterized protein KUCA_T00001134001 [Kuraishia capsulata CBS 1993]CDK25167.1 unnamed protein product [Kuraishia capsulata CBS 1993]